MAANTDFFNTELDIRSRIKLGVLSSFLPPWTAKLSTYAYRIGKRRIWFIDAFAGAGRYSDGSLGSPLLAAECALKHNASSGGAELAIYAVEEKRKYFSNLEREIQSYRAAGIEAIIKRGDFSNFVSEIVDITNEEPVLLFLDPFGVKSLDLEALKPLLGRKAPLDIIVRLHDDAIPRVAPDYPDAISRAVGSDAWYKAWSRGEDARVVITEVYECLKQSFREWGRMQDPIIFPVRLSLTAAPEYSLGLASRSIEAFRLWNDKLGELELQVIERSSNHLQGTFFGHPEFDRRNSEAEMVVLQQITDNPGLSGQGLIDWLIFNHPDSLRDTEVNSVIQRLLDSNLLVRESKGRGFQSGSFRITTTEEQQQAKQLQETRPHQPSMFDP